MILGRSSLVYCGIYSPRSSKPDEVDARDCNENDEEKNKNAEIWRRKESSVRKKLGFNC